MSNKMTKQQSELIQVLEEQNEDFFFSNCGIEHYLAVGNNTTEKSDFFDIITRDPTEDHDVDDGFWNGTECCLINVTHLTPTSLASSLVNNIHLIDKIIQDPDYESGAYVELKKILGEDIDIT